MTSHKKRSSRPPYYVNAGGSTFQPGPITLTGGRTILFCPTGQYFSTGITEAARNASTIFVRGYKERMSLRVGQAQAWQWRRIVFTRKGDVYNSNPDEFGADSNTVFRDTSADETYARVLNEVNGVALTRLQDYLFRGRQGRDWTIPQYATVDTTRVTLISDKTRVLRSGNDSAHFHQFKLWYPCNKNLIYDDDNLGTDGEVSSAYSTQAKQGMGDMYIYDLFIPENGVDALDSPLLIQPHGDLYWHEK